MISVSDSSVSGTGSSPGLRGSVLCSLARHLTLIVALSTQVYERVISRINAGGKPCDGLASHPGRSRNTPNGFML